MKVVSGECFFVPADYEFSRTVWNVKQFFYVWDESIDPDKEILLAQNCNYFLPINLNMCFGCSKEPSH